LRLKPATAKILIEKISLSFNAAMNYKIVAMVQPYRLLWQLLPQQQMVKEL
jgi:hypothetical protein